VTAPRRYAQGTTVSPEKSRMEVDRFLQRRGASSIGVMNDEKMFVVQFQIRATGSSVPRTVRIVVPRAAPPRRVGVRPNKNAAAAEDRRRWRALLLVLRAKFEAIDSGITTLDREFLAHLVTAAGTTIADALEPNLDRALAAADDAGILALPPGRVP
jgi:hypothetical protein